MRILSDSLPIFLCKTSVFQKQLNAVAVKESLCLEFLYGKSVMQKERCGRFF